MTRTAKIKLRQARRKFGSRSSRRRNLNGKINYVSPHKGKGTNSKLQQYRYPRPAKRVSVKIHQYMQERNKAV